MLNGRPRKAVTCRECLKHSRVADGLGRERDHARVSYYREFFNTHYFRNHLNSNEHRLEIINLKLDLLENYLENPSIEETITEKIGCMINNKMMDPKIISAPVVHNGAHSQDLHFISNTLLGDAVVLPMRHSIIECFSKSLYNVVETISKRNLKLVCSASYLRTLTELSRKRIPFKDGTGNSPELLSYIMTGLHTNIIGADLLLEDDVDLVIVADQIFGHHASKDSGIALCHINSSALSALYLAKRIKSVCVLDLDSHYGNGTAEILRGEVNIHYVGMETEPWADPTGVLEYRSYVTGKNLVNIPLEICTENYLDHLCYALESIKEHSPDALVLVGGVDTHYSDPYGMQILKEKEFKEIGIRVAEELKETGVKILLSTEGGYSESSFMSFVLLCNGIER